MDHTLDNLERIGRKDYVNFPLLDLFSIKTKIDSGAYTSSINCHFAKVILKNEEEVLQCKFLDPLNDQYSSNIYYFKAFKQKKIKSSNGISEIRYLIKTEIEIFEKKYPIELSLSDRSNMKYDALLGRKFLNNKFLIDTSVSNLSRKSEQKIKKNRNKNILIKKGKK